MNCQPESENNSKIPPANAEQPLMEALDYLRLASFIQYLKNDAGDGESSDNTYASPTPA